MMSKLQSSGLLDSFNIKHCVVISKLFGGNIDSFNYNCLSSHNGRMPCQYGLLPSHRKSSVKDAGEISNPERREHLMALLYN